MLKVYLAGGMRGTDWQGQLIREFPEEIYFFNPRTHGLKYSDQYTTWDTTAIEHCDILVAYLSRDNPSGVGMAAEVGYARALGKKIIFCIDSGREDDRYWDFVKELSDVITPNLLEVRDWLKEMKDIYRAV
jgi:nucleoside 2-deoxyribosyltransferase